jgi:hypothetical protein
VRPPDSLRQVAERALAGEPWRVAVRDFLDGFALAPPATRQSLIDDEPPAFDEAGDAYLAALAEHLAFHHGLARPAWCVDPRRFLTRMWFASNARGLRATAIQQSPAAFRRRGLFIGSTTLRRV